MTDISVGTEIPALKLPPITRTTLALYAGASGDHNPVHIDSDCVRTWHAFHGLPRANANQLAITGKAEEVL